MEDLTSPNIKILVYIRLTLLTSAVLQWSTVSLMFC